MKLSLAPIQGSTEAHYRNHFAAIFGGIDSYYAPFISTTAIQMSSPKLFKDLFPEFNDSQLNIVPQILGNNSTDFKDFASYIANMGYTKINWNIGCPFPTVTKKKKGSGLLAHPDMIHHFLEDVCKDLSYDLSIKMRLGFKHLEEGAKVIEILNDYPINEVIIHARTGIQKYAGTVDLDAFSELHAACKHEVAYNGDIYTLEDYKNISKRFPLINHFMIGRGALRDPFLPSLIKGQEILASEKIEKIQMFHQAVFEHNKATLSGDRHVCDRMKEFWTYLSVNIDPEGRYIKKIRKCHQIDAYSDMVSQMLEAAKTSL